MKNHQLHQRLQESLDKERHWQAAPDEWAVMQQRLQKIPTTPPSPFYFSPKFLLIMTTSFVAIFLTFLFFSTENTTTKPPKQLENNSLIEHIIAEKIIKPNTKETHKTSHIDTPSPSILATTNEHFSFIKKETISFQKTGNSVEQSFFKTKKIMPITHEKQNIHSTERTQSISSENLDFTQNDLNQSGSFHPFNLVTKSDYSTVIELDLDINWLDKKNWQPLEMMYPVEDTFIIRVPPVKNKKRLPLQWQVGVYGFTNGEFAPLRIGYVNSPYTHFGLGLKFSAIWKEKLRLSVYVNSAKNSYLGIVYSYTEPVAVEDFTIDNADIFQHTGSFQNFQSNSLEYGGHIDYSPFNWRIIKPYFGMGLHSLKIFEEDNQFSYSSIDDFVVSYQTSASTKNKTAITGILGTHIKIGKRMQVFTEGVIYLTTENNLELRESRYQVGMNYLF